jgi:hypothetical protein
MLESVRVKVLIVSNGLRPDFSQEVASSCHWSPARTCLGTLCSASEPQGQVVIGGGAEWGR